MKIGFASDLFDKEKSDEQRYGGCSSQKAVRSVVRVYFPTRNTTLSYYNDAFDLHDGDIVFVEGKLEGLRGRVTDINYNFKIKISDYKRVIAVADTEVHGKFQQAGSHFVSFDKDAIPYEKIRGWFKAPTKEEDEYVSGSDDSGFLLNDLKGMGVSSEVAERGHDYYMRNKVVYLCLEGSRGCAIVEGTEAYELEFTYRVGEITGLTCSCFCSYPCKHEFAAMLQLKETLKLLEKNNHIPNYFAAISKGVLFSMAIDGKEDGSFSL